MSATLRHARWVLRGNPLTLLAGCGCGLLVLAAVFGPWLAPYDPVASNV
ncbi:MAG: ABC transporter permease, partial [Acetobacteraceae bacterium]